MSRHSDIGLPDGMSRDDAYVQGVADGEAGIRESLGDSIYIIKEELEKAWITPEAANALRILENFANETDDE